MNMADANTGARAERFEVRVTADSHFAWLRTRLALERTIMCLSAPRWDPTHKLQQDIELSRRFASGVGSRSAPIGTPPSRQIAPTNQSLVSESGWGPTSLLIYTRVWAVG
jgi:hypothetical protein